MDQGVVWIVPFLRDAVRLLDVCWTTKLHMRVHIKCIISNREAFFFQNQKGMEMLYFVAKELKRETVFWLQLILQNESQTESLN